MDLLITNLNICAKCGKSLEFRSAKEFFVKSDKRKVIYEYITDMQLDEIKEK